jgi:two-component system response regulator DegU
MLDNLIRDNVCGVSNEQENTQFLGEEMSIKKNIRILLVDDYAPIRKSLRILLESVPEFEIVGEAEDGIIAMELTQKLLPDVVIMDVDMPVKNGIEATEWITSVFPDIKVIAYTASNDDIGRMIKAGASGLLHKAYRAKEIISAIKSVSECKVL